MSLGTAPYVILRRVESLRIEHVFALSSLKIKLYEKDHYVWTRNITWTVMVLFILYIMESLRLLGFKHSCNLYHSVIVKRNSMLFINYSEINCLLQYCQVVVIEWTCSTRDFHSMSWLLPTSPFQSISYWSISSWKKDGWKESD